MRNPFRRQTETAAPSLRERAADLRASLHPVAAPPASLPAPGSAEAMAAWLAACHEHSVRAAPLHDCPDLMTPRGDVWTKGTLGKALETGGITVADYARLYPLAAERELRFDQIGHELNVGPLFALAHADEYGRRPASKAEPASQEARDLCREAFAYAYALDLSPVPMSSLLRMYDVLHREAEALSDVAEEDRFYTNPELRVQNFGGEIIEAESNRLSCLRDVVVRELACRSHLTEAERDAALVVRVHHEMLCEMKIRSRSLLAEIREAWGGE